MKTIKDVKVDRVEKRRTPSKHYVYVIFVTWSDGGPYRIYRRYSRLFDLQSAILDKFPIEAGTVDPAARIIPFLPGKIIFGRSHIRDVAEKRLGPIDEYCKALITLHPRISLCDEVLEFFEVESEDLDPPTAEKSQNAVKKAEKISQPKTFKQYVAVADYDKQERGEIDLFQGMVVEVVEKKETGWWFVNSEDAQGWVPSTYLEPADGTVENVTIRLAPGQEEKYICCETFEASRDDDIGLEKGAIVEVLEKNMEGWWLVRYQGREGFAPATYLLKTEEDNMNSLSLTHRKSTEVEIIQNLADISNIMKNKEGEDEGDYSPGPKGDMYTKVRPKSLSLERGGSIKPPPRQDSKNFLRENSHLPSAQPKKSHYVTIAEFEDTVGDGISFSEGMSVDVKEKSESGWWFVSIEGQDGWVPSTYIQSHAAEENEDVYTTIEDSGEVFSDWSSDDDFDESNVKTDVKPHKKNKRNSLAESLMNQFRKRKSSIETDTKSSDNSEINQSKSSSALPTPPQKPPKNEGGGSGRPNGFSTLMESSQGLVNIIKSKFDRPTGSSSKTVDDTSKPTVTSTAKPTPRPKSPLTDLRPVLMPKFSKPEREKPSGGVQVIVLSKDKPLVPASKPSVPVKPAIKPKPPIAVKPTLSGKPSIPVKPATLKPVIAQKPGLPTKHPSISKPSANKFDRGIPPKLPAKILPTKMSNDNNNNDKKSDSVPSNGVAVQGLAAALQSKFENKNGGPPKLPDKQIFSNKANNENKTNFKTKIDEDVPKPKVSNLVNELSGKLNFGGDRPLTFTSTSDKDTEQSSQSHKSNGDRILTMKDNSLCDNLFVALQAFYGETEEELNVCEGDEVEVLEATDTGWWMVSLNGKKGWVPSDYLGKKQESPCPPVPPHANLRSKRVSVSLRTVYQTTAFFTAENEGELGFEDEQIVDEVIDQADADWWLIRIGLDEGWAPRSFFKQVQIEDNRKSFSGDKPVPPKIKPAFHK